jgi:hypothetical protein
LSVLSNQNYFIYSSIADLRRVYMDEASLKIKTVINQLLITHGGSAPHENTWISAGVHPVVSFSS